MTEILTIVSRIYDPDAKNFLLFNLLEGMYTTAYYSFKIEQELIFIRTFEHIKHYDAMFVGDLSHTSVPWKNEFFVGTDYIKISCINLRSKICAKKNLC